MPVESQFTRSNPSTRYRELVAQCRRLHEEGEAFLKLAPEETFPGTSLFPHLARIKRLVDETRALTLLDYGCGKGRQYVAGPIRVPGEEGEWVCVAEYWSVDNIELYDPAYEPFSRVPAGQCDGVICTDVLEHCPQEDLPWIIEELFCIARSFVYANVACHPARKRLPSGENAHVTVKPPEWWRELFERVAAHHSGIKWELHTELAAEPKPARTGARGGDVVRVQLDGIDADFFAPNEMTRWRAETLYAKEPVTIEWLRALPKGAVLFDIGANVGMYSIFAALAREAKVVAFEPESQNFAILNRNIALNRMDQRIQAYCIALSDRTGPDRLYLSEQHPGMSCHSLGAEVGHDLKPRPAAFVQGAFAVRLDDWIGAGALPVPGFVKIDVDGFEHRVLRGMAQTLRDSRVASLLIELNPHIPEHVEARDWLEGLGFRWDPAQVASSARATGPFEGVAEHVFRRA